MSLLEKTDVAVSAAGELVILAFGTTRYSLEFDLALQIAAAIRHEVRFAKESAGLGGWTQTRSVGVLHDAAAPKLKRKRFMQKLPELLRARDVAVFAAGQIVNLRFGNATRGIPWNYAFQIAQWIRVRGKEAKRNAGEHAHWSRIVAGKSLDAMTLGGTA